MPESLYPRPVRLAQIAAFQASHTYALGEVVKPTTPNNHIYYVTVAGAGGSEPSWPTSTQATVVSGAVTFTEHGLSPGVQYLKYLKRPKDWPAITVISEFEDGGRDFLERAASPPQYYELEYDGLLDTDAYILDAFYETQRLSVLFTFVEPRDHPWTGAEGNTVAGCNIQSYERNHLKVKGMQSRKIVIVKYQA